MRGRIILVMTALVFGFTGAFAVKSIPANASNSTVKVYQSTDLNGDGKKDTLSLTMNGQEYQSDYVIKINNAKIKGAGENVYDVLHIVDIDKRDKYKELAIEEDGPSDDLMTTFYGYDGKKLFKIGTIQGKAVTEKRIKGNGIVGATTRFSVLQTWYYPDEFKLNANRTLTHVNKKWYRSKSQNEVTLLKPLKLYTDLGSKKLKATLKKGDKVKITGSDDKSWCAVTTENGEIGWFQISEGFKVKQYGIDAAQVFTGLFFAD